RGFFGSRPFGRVNDWLKARGEPAIDWALSETAAAG
ncbi:uracil-DNA glycosylase, partial [Paracoccus sp. PXZ]